MSVRRAGGQTKRSPTDPLNIGSVGLLTNHALTEVERPLDVQWTSRVVRGCRNIGYIVGIARTRAR